MGSSLLTDTEWPLVRTAANRVDYGLLRQAAVSQDRSVDVGQKIVDKSEIIFLPTLSTPTPTTSYEAA